MKKYLIEITRIGALFLVILGFFLTFAVVQGSAQTPPADPSTRPLCNGDTPAQPTETCKVPRNSNCPGGREATTTASFTLCSAVAVNNNSQPVPAQNTPTNNGNAGYDFLRILPFDCLISTPTDVNVCNNGLLNALANFLISLATPLAVLVIIWGGYRYFLGGFEGKLEGMKTIQAALIGLALVYSAGFISTTVYTVFSSDKGFDAEALTPIFTTLTDTLINFSFILALLVIVWGGYQYLLGGFNGKSDGLKTIQAGVIGIVVISLARFIATTTESLFKGINTAADVEKIPNQVQVVLEPIITQIISVMQGLAGVVAVLVIIWGGYQYFLSNLPNGKKDGLEVISKGITGLIVVILSRPIVAIVQGTISAQNKELQINPSSIIGTIQVVVSNFLIPLSASIAVFFLILGAYQVLSSGGDSGKSKNGYTNIRNAVIGLVVVLLATTITQLVIYIFRNTNLVA